MKFKLWNLLVLLVVILTAVTYLFLFQENQEDPKIGAVPYIFWTGFIVTVVIVFATFLGSKFFPFEDPKKS
ncbi:hypothetical protein [Algoriphagus machipongonensis]|uniref:Uncharacterized protein n=1 Tax=Algoriphagus machipongonensis TaxID=388413 RepID=A3HTP1_9BACT|nr:hypothetical protein [Algoriphagus machipongonensis]EAZ83209.1 hypothetical protein ALPR1_13350 [Algoriphagus machipongonensis]